MNLVNVLAFECSALPVEAESIATISRTIIMLIQIVVPVLLIIWGMLDLGKAVMAQKDDEIKKGQQTFVKRLVAAAIVFFIVTIVGLAVKLVAPKNEGANIMGCAKCFINDSNCNFTGGSSGLGA